MTMQILDTAAQGAVSTAVGALSAQVGAAHQTVNAVTSAIFPPGWESASGQATAQQLANTAQFSAMLSAGLAEMAQVSALVNVNNTLNVATDAAAAAAFSAVSV